MGSSSSIIRWILALALALVCLWQLAWVMAQLIMPKAMEITQQSALLSIDFIRPQPEITEPEKPVEDIIEPETPPEPLTPPEPPATEIPSPKLQPQFALDDLTPTVKIKQNRDWLSEITPMPDQPKPSSPLPAVKPAFSSNLFPISQPSPVYPRRAKSRKIQGWVNVEFTITTAGRVKDVVVLAAEPEGIFERNTLKTVKRWKFKPQLLDGKPTQRRVVQTIKFELDR